MSPDHEVITMLKAQNALLAAIATHLSEIAHYMSDSRGDGASRYTYSVFHQGSIFRDNTDSGVQEELFDASY